MRLKDGVGSVGANFYYAEIEDTFLYTTSTGVIYCINIANPESMFVAWTVGSISGGRGFAILDGTAYMGDGYCEDVYDDFSTYRSVSTIKTAINLDTSSPSIDSMAEFTNRDGGDIGKSESSLFYVETYLSNWDVETETGYVFGTTRLGVWGSDYSYTWSEPDDEIAIGLDVLNDKILAVGFEHGFSIINYQQLDGMREVAYYRNTDSTFGFSHFALKENRLFAVAHPHWGVCRLYMFTLSDSVITGLVEADIPLIPDDFRLRAYPNPFNATVKIAFDCHTREGGNPEGAMSVEIFDVNGRRVAQLPDGGTAGAGFTPARNDGAYDNERDGARPSPTTREFTWSPDKSLPSGVYLVRACFEGLSDQGGAAVVKRIVYLK